MVSEQIRGQCVERNERTSLRCNNTLNVTGRP